MATNNDSGGTGTYALPGLLGNSNHGVVALSPGHARVYQARLETMAEVGGLLTSESHLISYEVGAKKRKGSLVQTDSSQSGVSMEFDTPASLLSAIDYRSENRKGNHMFSAAFGSSDLCALVARMSAAHARFANTGALAFDLLSNGNTDLVIRQRYDGKIGQRAGSLYIPNLVGENSMDRAEYLACVGAALGCGSTVVVDQANLDPNTGAPIIDTAEDEDLAEGLRSALVRIGGMMAMAGAGASWVHSCAVGIHSEVSVSTHTLDGRYMREVMRVASFTRPYGLVHLGVPKASAVQEPQFAGVAGESGYVDRLAIWTAASCMTCAPTEEVDGENFPMVFSSGPTSRSTGVYNRLPQIDANECARDVANQLVACSRPFGLRMAIAYDGLLASDSNLGCHEKVAGYIEHQFLVARANSHNFLARQCSTPFMWVENTSIIGREVDMSKMGESVAPMCLRGEEKEVPLVKDCELATLMGDKCAIFSTRWKNARSNPLMLHSSARSMAGLSEMKIKRMEAEAFCLHAVGDGASDFVSQGTSFDMIASDKGPNSLFMPHEQLLYNGFMTVESTMYDVDRFGMPMSTGSVQTGEVMGECDLTIVQPQFVGVHSLEGDYDVEVDRRRTTIVAGLNLMRGELSAPSFGFMTASAQGTWGGQVGASGKAKGEVKFEPPVAKQRTRKGRAVMNRPTAMGGQKGADEFKRSVAVRVPDEATVFPDAAAQAARAKGSKKSRAKFKRLCANNVQAERLERRLFEEAGSELPKALRVDKGKGGVAFAAQQLAVGLLAAPPDTRVLRNGVEEGAEDELDYPVLPLRPPDDSLGGLDARDSEWILTLLENLGRLEHGESKRVDLAEMVPRCDPEHLDYVWEYVTARAVVHNDFEHFAREFRAAARSCAGPSVCQAKRA